MRHFDLSGEAQGGEVVANTTNEFWQTSPVIGVDASDGYVVA